MAKSNVTVRSPIIKRVWELGSKKIVIIDSSIVEKLGMSENNMSLQQEITEDGNILMRLMKKDNLSDYKF